MIRITPELIASFPDTAHLFDQLMQLRGDVFRDHKNRRTQRICLQNQFWFLKQHHAMGWREIMGSLLKGQLPVLGATREWRALSRLRTLGIPVPDVCAVGSKGWNPARTQSFLLTRELPSHVTLETLASQKLPFHFKCRLIRSVGNLAGTLHRAGINHRDFYLCHLLLDRRTLPTEKMNPDPLIYVIDLHRAGLRQKTPLRWMLKDLAGLDFSSRKAQLTRTDHLRFMRAYEAAAGCHRQPTFWKKVRKRGDKLTQKHRH